jgi:hypothetical protein
MAGPVLSGTRRPQLNEGHQVTLDPTSKPTNMTFVGRAIAKFFDWIWKGEFPGKDGLPKVKNLTANLRAGVKNWRMTADLRKNRLDSDIPTLGPVEKVCGSQAANRDRMSFGRRSSDFPAAPSEPIPMTDFARPSTTCLQQSLEPFMRNQPACSSRPDICWPGLRHCLPGLTNRGAVGGLRSRFKLRSA